MCCWKEIDTTSLLSGLAIGGSGSEQDDPPSVLAGLSLPPLKSLTVPASADDVHQLHLKEGMRVVAHGGASLEEVVVPLIELESTEV